MPVPAWLAPGALASQPESHGWALATLAATAALVVAIKRGHDALKAHHARLVDRYIEVVGRISALLIGTFAVQMIFEGLGTWLQDTSPMWR